MSGMVGTVSDRQDRPAYVRFEFRPVEDRLESIKQGRSVMRDVEIAIVTPPYSKDEVEFEIAQWMSNMRQDVSNQRLPEAWYEKYKEAYDKWKLGQEMPLEGTPLKGWGMITPAQQQNMIAINIRTVEDLAVVNDEGIRRLGMGALDLRNKARAWLADVKNHGANTQQIAALLTSNTVLQNTVETLQQQIIALRGQVNADQAAMDEDYSAEPQVAVQEITAADILTEDPPPRHERQKSRAERYAEKFGKPPHHRMLPETIDAALKE